MSEAKANNRKLSHIKEVIKPEDQWEPVGPTPMPGMTDLRNWDMRLLKTYEPFYAPFCDLCCFCTYGKCDLTAGKRGACGIDIAAQQARIVLLACVMGLSSHGGHARHIIDFLIDKHGADLKIDLGEGVVVEAPHIRTVLGLKPVTLGDLSKVMDYVEAELIHLVAALHTGNEGSNLDFESKAFHAGMLDHVAMEAADLAQISGFKYPTSKADPGLVDVGWGAVDKKKPLILVIGHNPATSTSIVDYLNKNGLNDAVEIAGICCTALETTRYSNKAKVIGPLSRQLHFVRTGFADVIVTDEQCIRTDMPEEARKVGSGLVATSDKACYGLENMSEQQADDVVHQMVRDGKQVLILDSERAAEVAVKAAIALAPKRKKELITKAEAQELAKECRDCGVCDWVCPNLLPTGPAMTAAGQGSFEKLQAIYNRCIGCGKCEVECPRKIPIFKVMQAVASTETYKMRAGRGPIMDTEIRNVGAPIVLGTIPGVVAFVGCSNYPDDIDVIAEMVEEFAKRKFIVVLSGCSAMTAAMKKDADGKTIYEKYSPNFDSGGVVMMGSCVANAHISGAAIKIANIFASLPLRGNYEVMADYVLNRVGAVGVAWGAYSQKAAAIATGCNRLGIPVLLGPHSAKYRRLFLSRKEDGDWTVMDGRKGELVNTQEPSPEHLAYVIESKERAMVAIAKMCIRKNDTPQGRALKLNHYISLHKKYMGGLPDDLHLYVRRAQDIPLVYKKEVMAYLKEVGWKDKPVLSLPTLIGTYPSKVRLDAVIR